MAKPRKSARPFFRRLALAASAWVGVAAAPAHATVEVTGYTYTPQAVFGGFTIAGNAYTGNAGRFLSDIHDLATDTTVQRYTWCVDALTPYFTYAPYDVVSLSSAFADPVKQSQLAALLSHADAAIAAAGDSNAQSIAGAGMALAIWEIVYESGNSGYSLGSGNFSAWGDFTLGSIAAGNDYLGKVENLTWQGNAGDVRMLSFADRNSPTQNQIYLQGSVPEPATWLTMLLGFGLLGAMLRRQRVRGGVGFGLSPA
ncbi:MAG: PEP-CTERM sorting domain-containing protein [Sphingomonadales bacterium]|nr:PEP-CTERM sorting domain-containing protein [Sphingomonadales bacterium]